MIGDRLEFVSLRDGKKRRSTRRKPIKRPEQALQRACVGLLERFYEPLPDVFWTAINPVPGKSMVAAAISKAMGMKAGIPDMIFIRKAIDHFVFFIEFKAGKGQLSPSQKALKLLFSAFQPPIHVYEIRSIDQFVAALDEQGIEPIRKFTLRKSADEYLTNRL